MRPLTPQEEVLLQRHVSLTRTVSRYSLFERRLKSAVTLQSTIVSAIESLPEEQREQEDADNLGRLLQRMAIRVPRIGPAGRVAETFRVLREANYVALQESLRS